MKHSQALLSTFFVLVASSCVTRPETVQADPPFAAAPTPQPSPPTSPELRINPSVPSSVPVSEVYVTVSEETNVRNGPGTIYEVVGQMLPEGQYMVSGRNHDWLEIQFDNETAWVFSSLVAIDGDPSSIPELSSPDPVDPQPKAVFENGEIAIECIRGFLGQPDLSLEYVELAIMINSPNADRQVAVFEDQLATRYSVDPSTCTLVQIEPSGIRQAAGSPVSLDVIRQTAQDLASISPGFVSLEPTLQYEEGLKNELHFFTWIDTQPGWKFNRPRLQVGILDDGSLHVYMNTLIWGP